MQLVREGEGKKGLLLQAARETRPSKGMPIGKRYNTQGSDDGRSAAKTNYSHDDGETGGEDVEDAKAFLALHQYAWFARTPVRLREHRHPCRNSPKPTST
jgi:hypothetical protein